MTTLAFIRPADDAAAVDLSAWGDDLRRTALAHGAQIVDHAGPANTSRSSIDSLLASAPDHVVWFGHGRDDALVASSSPLVDAANVGHVSGVLVAIACDAAKALGPTCVGGTLQAFLGFDDHLGWPAQAPGPTRDAIVNGINCLFTQSHDLDCAARQLRQGFSAARNEYEFNGHSYGLSQGDATTAWLFAKSNAGSVRVQGDNTATLS